MTEKQFNEQIKAKARKAALARTAQSRIAAGKKSWVTRKANALARK